jgi:hypothetical protein
LYKNCKLSSAETNLSLILKERIFIEWDDISTK